ncbi:hypothetical protein O181_016724 [Austropuccinia psidii MF-1]|uniref:Uncharacterized protein n=1 Tax=Austropuccinia psidii MF-1 TaxID=1389203 RepID=A0A9Q3GS34_9BASI|nr:hypothetical protein [Austropuccinia psidii MF-1]
MSPGQISRQSSAIDFTLHRASRQRQSSHVSHDNVTQSPNPFQHYLQCLGNFTSLACPSPSNLPRRFACLRTCTALQMRLQHCPSISVLTTPYALTPPPLPSLCSRVPSQHPPDTAYHTYARGVHSQHDPDTTYPYARGVPSQHAPNTTYPYACRVPSQHAPNTTYPYACVVPSQHHLSLRLCSALPTSSRHHLSLRLCSALPTSS